MLALAAVCTWRFIPESKVRSPGKINWLAATLLTVGMSCLLIGIAQTTAWGWTGLRTLILLGVGVLTCVAWVVIELRSSNPLIDMAMMRVRGVWTVNLAAFLVGGGLYAWFLLLPQFAQLPRSTGFGYGASVVVAGLYLLPCAVGMGVLGSVAGRVERRFSSRSALIAGAAVSAVACGWLTIASRHPYDMLLSSTLLGIGIGLAFAALGNLIVQAVPANQTGAASGMNTVLRTLGGAVGGQIAATFVVGGTVGGPARPDRLHHQDLRDGRPGPHRLRHSRLPNPAPHPGPNPGPRSDPLRDHLTPAPPAARPPLARRPPAARPPVTRPPPACVGHPAVAGATSKCPSRNAARSFGGA